MSFFGSKRKSDQEEDEDITPSVQIPPPPQLPSSPSGQQSIGFETVLGASCMLEGKLTSNGNIRIDGAFTGTLEIIGNILVGETAKVTADVDARNISIAGSVRGNVSGNKVQLLHTAKVWGDISAITLTTEAGAFIDGKVSISGHDAAEEPAKEDDEVSDDDAETDNEDDNS